MSQPETDGDYRARIMKVCSQEDRERIYMVAGKKLDEMGRKYDRYRTGVPLFEESKKEDAGA